MNQEDKDFIHEAIKINNESLLSGMDENFKEMSKRFDGVDKRLDGVDKRLENLESAQKTIHNHVRMIPGIFTKLEDNRRKIPDLKK